ncbi:MAG: nitrile hydratase subunit beta [Alphaproteobacteria bacterium]|nr:nitrile hydratase subunit beta [Alphaproteobacteria bacterium]
MVDVPRGVNDWGGGTAGAVDRDEHDLSLYEKRVDALLMLVANSGRDIVVDSHRRAQEALSREDYDKFAYYDRWIVALRQNLVEAGVFSEAEVQAKLASVMARHAEPDAAAP